MSTKLTSVFLIEDSKGTRAVLKRLLVGSGAFAITGEASDGDDALQSIAKNQPEIALVDIRLDGELDGVEVAKRIKEAHPHVRALMLTSSSSEDDLFDSFAAGADGYILKDNFDPDKLLMAIDCVLRNQTWLDPAIARRVLDIASKLPRVQKDKIERIEPLSDDERSLLQQTSDLELSECLDGMCTINAQFLQRLHRFSRKGD